MLKVCITGHRDLLYPDDIRRKIAYSLKYFAKRDTLTAITAIAAGADILFAEEAKKQGIPIEITLPFGLDQYREDFEGSEDKDKFEELIQSHPYQVFHPAPVNNQDEKNEAYLGTGQLMVDQADIVLAVWNGKPSSGKGGTGDIVTYARSNGKELYIIKAIRKSKPGKPDEQDNAEKKFSEFDTEAVSDKKDFSLAWLAGIIMGVLAVVCFAIGKAFELSHSLKFWFALAETLFILFSFVALAFIAKNLKNSFLLKRRNAEYLRTILLYRDGGIPIPPIETTDYKPGEDILDIEKEISAGLLSVTDLKNAKRTAWCLADDQMNYHQHTRIDRFTEKLENTEFWLSLIKVVFFITAGLSFASELLEYLEVKNTCIDLAVAQPVLLLLALILPPAYAALEGIKYFGEWKRNIYVSKKILAQLGDAEDAIYKAKNDKELLEATKDLRNILEIENSDWAVRYDEKEVGSKI